MVEAGALGKHDRGGHPVNPAEQAGGKGRGVDLRVCGKIILLLWIWMIEWNSSREKPDTAHAAEIPAISLLIGS